MTAAYLNASAVVCALGATHDTIVRRMMAGETGIAMTDAFTPGRALPVGVADVVLPSLESWPVRLRSRNNALALAAAQQLGTAVAAAVERYGAHRVAVVIGTSTSGIGESERALRERTATGRLPSDYAFAQQELGTLAEFVAGVFGVTGPTYVHSSACASSAKAMASAARLIRSGLADAAVTGGVDALSGFTLHGFDSLALLSADRSNSLSRNRNGINIGEAAALFLMTGEPATVRLAGWGESSDGHHFSAPDPSGRGAAIAIGRALVRAGVSGNDVSYVNLHGTGTRANDLMESHVVHAVAGDRVPVSSTKPLTGHTLGAAGGLEAALCWMAMQDANAQGLLPPHLWDGEADSELAPLRVVAAGDGIGAPPRIVLSTSFAFGGANAALVFARE